MSAAEVLPADYPEYHCSDCNCIVSARTMGPAAIAKGSTVREPGEPLCGGCSASRAKLVREMDKIPSTLEQIRALRMRGTPNVPKMIPKGGRR